MGKTGLCGESEKSIWLKVTFTNEYIKTITLWRDGFLFCIITSLKT